MRKAWKALVGGLQQQLDPVLVRDLGFENQAFCVHKEMTLPTAHLLPSVVTALLSTYTGCLRRLGVHYPRAGLGVSAPEFSQALAQLRVKMLESTLNSPFPEPVVNDSPGWKVVPVCWET